MSDGWAGYFNIENLCGGIYSHYVVNHTIHFIDPTDNTIHTQNIENTWMRTKHKLRKQFSTRKNLFAEYLTDFMWKQRFHTNQAFQSIIKTL